MTRQQLLLLQLGEEAAEIVKEVSKCLRFGPDEIYPKIGVSNIDRVYAEFNDLLGIVEMLQVENLFPADLRNEEMVYQKKVKVEKHLEYSKECGILEDE